jgi:hypothetical protein
MIPSLLKSFKGTEIEYRSVDSEVHTEDAIHHLVEFLNILNLLASQPSKLLLKVGAPVLLLRNVNPPNSIMPSHCE